MSDDSYYIAYTYNLDKRLSQHDSAKSGYTSKKQPWILKYSESFIDKSEAIKREHFLKNQKNRNFIERLTKP
ncbi:MAG: GIY-YIG nuclease family protein [Bacteroidales bacterium]|nr:GIY-YIG nuclease family protein [Bacteroidales bacterium]